MHHCPKQQRFLRMVVVGEGCHERGAQTEAVIAVASLQRSVQGSTGVVGAWKVQFVSEVVQYERHGAAQ